VEGLRLMSLTTLSLPHADAVVVVFFCDFVVPLQVAGRPASLAHLAREEFALLVAV